MRGSAEMRGREARPEIQDRSASRRTDEPAEMRISAVI